MLEKKIDNKVNLQFSPINPHKRARTSNMEEHQFEIKPDFTGKWDNLIDWWKRVGTQYLKARCGTYSKEVRTYCSCNKKVVM